MEGGQDERKTQARRFAYERWAHSHNATTRLYAVCGRAYVRWPTHGGNFLVQQLAGGGAHSALMVFCRV